MMENIHSETYSLLIDTYKRYQGERLPLQCHRYARLCQEKSQLGLLDQQGQFQERLIAFAAVEAFSSPALLLDLLAQEARPDAGTYLLQ
jgi:hypothetical protein